jgi:predicted RNA-binding protein with TRAM domain
MDLPDPLCLFTGRIDERDDAYVVTVPKQEVELGTLDVDATYRFGAYPGPPASPSPSVAGETRSADASDGGPASGRTPTSSNPAVEGDAPDQPPVTEGELLELEIEDVGDQGDGLARVGPGYVVFVPDAEVGQQPVVRVTTVRETFAFAEIVG